MLPLPQVRESYQLALDLIRGVEFAFPPNEPTPEGYYRELVRGPSPARSHEVRRRIRYYLALFELAGRDPEGASVLEAGTGFGLGLILLGALGVQEARGIEIVPWMAAYAQRCQEVLPNDMRSRLQAVAGDANDMPYEDESFDVVLSTEAISHYLEYRPFLAEAHRVLRPGGVLVVSDGNNGLNPLIRRRTYDIWASHEVDPVVESERGEHYENHPWWLVNKRKEILLASFPQLSEEVAHRLALHTSGLVREQVVAAGRAYLEEGVEPSSPYRRGVLTVHPDHEMVMERLFNPFELGREIATFGFRVRVRGHWAGASGKRWHRTADRMLGSMSRVTMFAARGFRIAAVKLG